MYLAVNFRTNENERRTKTKQENKMVCRFQLVWRDRPTDKQTELQSRLLDWIVYR